MWEILEITLTVATTISFVTAVFVCICGRKKDAHNELVGTAGVVKLRLEEENQHSAQLSPFSSKRVSSQNSHRSLPEIPSSVPRQDSGDTTSELYATVGTNQQASSSAAVPVNISDHPYEHAYAKLQEAHRNNDIRDNENVAEDSNVSLSISVINSESNAENEHIITASNAISGQVSSSRDLPYMTPPIAASEHTNQGQNLLPQPNQHFSGDSVDSAKGYTSISVREPLSSIRPSVALLRTSQPHYTTVSDDSDEMYAAIDDPSNQVYTSGSETYAQIQPITHMSINSTVTNAVNSDTTVYSCTSSTQTTVYQEKSGRSGMNIKQVSSDVSTANQGDEKYLKQVLHSEMVNTVGSPKPEKRQANSPLPPPPSLVNNDSSETNLALKKSHDSPSHCHKSSKHHKISSTGNLHEHDKLRRSLNEKHQRNNSCVSSSDFYGCNYPVDKHRFSSGDLVKPLTAKELKFSFNKLYGPKLCDDIYNTIDGSNELYAAIDQDNHNDFISNQPNISNSPIKNVEEMYAKVIKKSSKQSAPDQHTQPLLSHDEINFKQIEKTKNIVNSIPMRKKKSHHGNDRLSWSEETRRFSGANAMYDVSSKNMSSGKILNVHGLNKDDPCYETIDKTKNKTQNSDNSSNKFEKLSDVGYETVREYNKPGVTKKYKTIPTVSGGLMQQSTDMYNMDRISVIEPGYETVPSGPESLISNDPGYEHIRQLERCPSDSDPNYEVLHSRNSTPPYSSVQSKSQNNYHGYSVVNKKNKDRSWVINNNDNFLSEPNYESMPNETSYNTGSESDPNYESVGPKDPNYESVKYFDSSMRDPPYEKVKNDMYSTIENSPFQRSNSSSYEKAKHKKNNKPVDDDNDNKTNGFVNISTDNASVADYFQV